MHFQRYFAHHMMSDATGIEEDPNIRTEPVMEGGSSSIRFMLREWGITLGAEMKTSRSSPFQ
jgi:hypothetical protein